MSKAQTPEKTLQNFQMFLFETLVGRIILGISIALVIVLFFFVYQWHSAKSIFIDLLPQQTTLGFVEIKDWREFQEKIDPNQSLETEMNTLTQLDFSTQVAPWLGNDIAIALIHTNQQTGTVFLTQSTDATQSTKFFETLAHGLADEIISENTDQHVIYSFASSLPLYYTYDNGVLIVADNKAHIEQILQTSAGQMASLKESDYVNKIQNNLPRNKGLFAFIQHEVVLNSFEQIQQIMHGYAPLVELFKASGVSMQFIQNDLVIHGTVHADKTALESQKVYESNEKFSAQLINEVPAQYTIFYDSGMNVGKQIEDTLDDLNELNPAFATIAEGILETQVKKYLGGTLSFRADIIPLLSKEYAFFASLDPEIGKPTFNVILETESLDLSQRRLSEVFKGLVDYSAQVVPTVRERTLPDGTTVQELVADESKVNILSETYNNIAIEGIDIIGYPFGYYYATNNNRAYISTHPASLKKLLDSSEHTQESLAKDANFQSLNRRLLLNTDELVFIDIQTILPIFATGLSSDEDWSLNTSFLIELLEPFKTMVSKAKGFDDGLSFQAVLRLR